LSNSIKSSCQELETTVYGHIPLSLFLKRYNSI
jgi:hypothetical protein